jgi:DNA-binding LacI/PurR family transcriptional regulator
VKKMASIRDLAKELKLSPATVSRALNNNPLVAPEVRRRVLNAANKLQYVPTIGRRETMNIAFAYAGDRSIGSPFDAALMEGLTDRMEAGGFDLVILDVKRAVHPRETFSHMFRRKGIRGAVLRTTSAAKDLCIQIAEEGFPCVVVGETFENESISVVRSDSLGSSRDAVNHLIDLKHEKIAIAVNLVDDSDHLDRIAGYREAMASRGLPVDDRLIFRIPAKREGGIQLVRRIAAMPDRPTALFFADPLPAIGAMMEAQKIGWNIPRDLSIVGFDDAELRFMVHPTMTAICQDARELGRVAFESLDLLFAQKGRELQNSAVRRTLPTQLECHGSTGPFAS